MSEGFVIPECAVLEHEPAPGFAEPAPAFALVAVAADPARRVEVPSETEILLVGNEIGIGGVHVGLRRVGGLFVER